MKIAVHSGVIPSTTFIESLIVALASEGHHIYLFGKRRESIKYQSPNIHPFPTPVKKVSVILFVLCNAFRLRLKNPKAYRLLKKYVTTRSPEKNQRWRNWAKYLPVVLNLPDIFHIQWAKSVEEWIFLKKDFGVKLVLSLRGAHINYSPVADASLTESYRRCFPNLDGFHGVSKAIIEEGKQYGADPEKSFVIYSGVYSELTNAYQKSNYELETPIRLLSVGRFHWKKGYHCALDAMHILKTRGVDVHYTIIAGRTPPEELLYQVQDLDLTDRVVLSPKVPHQEVLKAMQRSDVLLLPSVEEGIANVVLEAMAIGLPVVSSNCGGMPEVIEDGVNGFLFENRNPAHLADRIEEMTRLTPKERKLLAQNGRNTIKAQHSIDQLGQKMEDLYKAALCISD